jgi:hypothetical protein
MESHNRGFTPALGAIVLIQGMLLGSYEILPEGAQGPLQGSRNPSQNNFAVLRDFAVQVQIIGVMVTMEVKWAFCIFKQALKLHEYFMGI